MIVPLPTIAPRHRHEFHLGHMRAPVVVIAAAVLLVIGVALLLVGHRATRFGLGPPEGVAPGLLGKSSLAVRQSLTRPPRPVVVDAVDPNRILSSTERRFVGIGDAAAGRANRPPLLRRAAAFHLDKPPQEALDNQTIEIRKRLIEQERLVGGIPHILDKQGGQQQAEEAVRPGTPSRGLAQRLSSDTATASSTTTTSTRTSTFTTTTTTSRPAMVTNATKANGMPPPLTPRPPFQLLENSNAVPWLPRYLGTHRGMILLDGRDYHWEVARASRPRVLRIDNVLNTTECESIVAVAERQLARSSVIDLSGGVAKSKVDSYRTSDGMFLQSEEQILLPANQRYRKVIAAVLGLQLPWIEMTQVLRYREGEYYKPHPDYFSPGDATNLNRGGQRIASAILTLRAPSRGGETSFPTARFSVKASQGSVVVFYDVLEDGSPDPSSLHAGLPPEKGSEKWVAVLWAHTRPFY